MGNFLPVVQSPQKAKCLAITDPEQKWVGHFTCLEKSSRITSTNALSMYDEILLLLMIKTRNTRECPHSDNTNKGNII
jgi:hypothetical protein